jgi:hypothetical protein
MLLQIKRLSAYGNERRNGFQPARERVEGSKGRRVQKSKVPAKPAAYDFESFGLLDFSTMSNAVDRFAYRNRIPCFGRGHEPR